MENDGKKKAKILVVDDEPRNVRLLSLILKAEGYDVLQGYSGEEALKIAGTDSPDLILLDIMMPRIDGYEVCKKLREVEQTKAIPIVMITALQGLDEKVKALDIGADDFISKPLIDNKIEVLARIRTLLRVKYLHDELAHANKKLEEQNQILEDELKMAREVQEALLPKDIETQMPPGLELYYEYIPARVVGGDFFDIAKISPGVIGVFIADVMGHGAQPALITVLIKTLLSELVHKMRTPAELLAELNRRYNALVRTTGIFASAFYLTVDVNKEKVVFSNAGHPPALLIRKEKLEVKELPKESGLALGLANDYNYQNHKSKLEKGDTILLYTDGLSDIANRNGETFGLEHLKSIVADNLNLPNAILIQTIINAINKFTGDAPSPDDITVLTIGLAGNGNLGKW